MLIVIAKAVIGILIVCVALYVLSTAPKGKGVDCKARFTWMKNNVFKLLTIGLILYAAYLNILYANTKKSNREYHEDYFRLRVEMDSLTKVNNQLLQEIDSLKADRTKLSR